MKCSVTQGAHNCEINVKMVNHKSPYRKEPDFDNIVDQLCFNLQDIKDQDSPNKVGMHLAPPEHTEAVQKYYAAFPALKKGEESPQQYYLPPPAWCRKSAHDNTQIKMQSSLPLSKEFNNHKNKKIPTGKERRNSYQGQRKSNKKRSHNYSRSFESKENLPEWVTHEGVWDMETQDPIKEFIKAIALDEGYGTCENTVTDEIREITQLNVRMNETKVPDWDDGLDLESEWVITDDLIPRERSAKEEEIYAKFEAKFNRSIEALWSNDQANTPDDEYQELPIDFQDLLTSPSDNQFAEPTADKCCLISLSENIWSNDAYDSFLGITRAETPTRSVELLHDRFKPLNLTDDVYKAEPTPIQVVQEAEPFSLYSYEGIYEAVPTVSDVMRSLTVINHCKNSSSFAEVIPRRPGERAKTVVVEKVDKVLPENEDEREDLLLSDKTHFRPIRKEGETTEVAGSGYADGDTFDIRGELEAVHFHRSDSGFMYLETEVESPKRYLEYRTRSIDYSRLNLTEEQRCGNDMSNMVDRDFKLKFPVRMMEKGVQTEDEVESDEGDARAAWACDECGRRGGAKKMRQSGIESIWSDADYCGHCSVGVEQATVPAPDELSREWEELLSDISAAHAQYATEATIVEGGADRKRRHSAALRCRPHAACTHPHAPFLHCAGSDRPLTR